MQPTNNERPFFAQFLEAQQTENRVNMPGASSLTTRLLDGGYETMKYPSDSDEGGPLS
ncbi:microviridin/marinostatin family tricyclic proteinase inhibitor [Chitinophaga pendula]|uniref:microviridin/marinostatin family tricyclic proteinase inhibitor n=1 Tax=Chitinophaga TaxID=79328 RepID=UPI000BAE8698|nr:MULTISPECIES: microviridin/marinostatin family tricyclic proteinase inhibitor [Chitinophaga]ASZ12353.1 hypothetical protein CK934_15985 [Chitinophaga sp. MD30]UCJ10053.1 microviridin/marinostatin family tricyclic proteinase inhibitor [Chitinophaga pendula]